MSPANARVEALPQCDDIWRRALWETVLDEAMRVESL